jgi:DNA-binding YbaB/EbfC family protein
MAKFMDSLKQATAMRGDLKKMQKQLAAQTVAHSSGGVSVEASGDGSVVSIEIEEQLVNPERSAKLEKAVLSAVNGALDKARKEAAKELQKLAGGLGLPPGLL